MITEEQLEQLKTKLNKIASEDTWEKSHNQEVEDTGDDEYFSVYEWCGGNFDDAYQGGVEQGRVDLADEILGALYRAEKINETSTD